MAHPQRDFAAVDALQDEAVEEHERPPTRPRGGQNRA
jgi:hypothetical protein